MHSLVLSTALAVVPTAYEVDFGALPPAQAQGANKYTIILSFKGEPDVKIPTTIARKLGSDGAANSFIDALDDARWKIKRTGNCVTVYGYDDVRIFKVAVTGDGPKPLVRRVPLAPEKK